MLEGRRPSESFVPVPATRKGKTSDQQALDFDTTGERRETNSLINDIRREVELWRHRGYRSVAPYTRKLLEHWSAKPPARDDPMFFCQREAAETAIFLAEVAGRGGADYRGRIDPENAIHNDGLPRVALKMATGTGKTVVMAMIIAWQTINKVFNPRDTRFSKRFLVVAPGITIRTRLRVLQPTAVDNYYRERDIVPSELWDALLQAQIVIANYHQFLLKDSKEIQGVAANTRKILLAGKKTDPFRETQDQMVERVLRDLGGSGKGEIIVLNDEAHHCYQDKPLTNDGEEDAESRQRNADARVWFKGLQAVQKKVGIKTIFDLSATPFYLKGSGYLEGYIFPWTVSDFSLMDAIESGIVKIPRIPIDDDAAGDLVTYLRLWDHVGDKLPKRKTKRAEIDPDTPLPQVLEGALFSLYRSYEDAFIRYERELGALGEPPPVFIVVCPNTVVSKLVYDWISGREIELPDGSVRLRSGQLSLLANVVDGAWTDRQRTILIDSAQLESGEAMSDDFKKAAAHEIEVFKNVFRIRHPGADVEKITDEDLLREVMNTVGKKGMLGEHVRCVVSVSMLTEGWDANTVTHILGIRKFGSQLLCEQVVGRGLRRRNYAVNEDGRFEPEYAEVYGVPFAFIPSDRPTPTPPPRPPAVLVQALDERADLRISFPKVDGYRVEIPDEHLYIGSFEDDARVHLDRSRVALWTQTGGIVGETSEQDLEKFRRARKQTVAYEIAETLVRRHFAVHDAVERPWLFPELVDITRQWLDSCVTVDAGSALGMLLLGEGKAFAAEKIFNSIAYQEGARSEFLMPILRRFDPEGSTDDVCFPTRKATTAATKSHVNVVVLDGPKGNTWEEHLAGLLEDHPDVYSFVKNDHLGFSIPYVHEGRTHDYVPDFLVRLKTDANDLDRTLIVEVSGRRKVHHSPGPVVAKSETARNQWCQAVNNHRGFGVWGYAEVKSKESASDVLSAALDDLLHRTPVGLPR